MSSFVDVAKPSGKSLGYTYDILCVFGGSLLLALLAQVSICLWFTPVPITLQPFGVILLGALLGSKRGAISVTAYLFEGALGWPVFAGGSAGFYHFVGPTGGYLIGFVLSAYVIGLLLERGWKESYRKTLFALILGSATLLAVGALWLSFYVGASNALLMGVYPFLVGSVLKIFAAAALIPTGWKALSKIYANSRL